MLNGSAVVTAFNIDKEFYVNDGHYSKEHLFILHSSIILPKNSPLEVSHREKRHLF